jgi:hypothetical protein
MAITKEIEIKVNTSGADTNIEKINNLFKEVNKSVSDAEKTSEALRDELNKLQKEMASGNLSGSEFDVATKRAGELKNSISEVSKNVGILSTSTQKLDAFISFGTSIAGAFSVAQGAMGAFGSENEKVNEAILKVQSSLAMLNGVQAIANTLKKDSALMTELQTASTTALTIAQKAYAVVVGTSTGALKLFRMALISTGIGALVVGIGLLVANFEKVSAFVTDLIDKFGGWRKVLMFVSPPIYLIIKALEMLGIIDDEATAKAKANAEERIKANRKESLELDKKRKSTEEYYDFEIRKAKASGKNTEEVEKQKRTALLATLKAQNELEKSWIKTSKATEEDVKRWNERQKQIKTLLQELEVADLEANKARQDKAKELSKEAEKRAEDNRKIRESEQKALLAIEENFKKQEQDLNDKTDEQRLATARKRQLREIEQMKGTEADKQKARLEVEKFYDLKDAELKATKKKEAEDKEKERQAKITEIQQEFSLKRRELEAVTEEEKKAIELEKIDIERQKKEQELIDLQVSEEQRLEILKSFGLRKEEVEKKFEEDALAREKAVASAKLDIAKQTLQLISEVAGKGSKIGKGLAIAQATISGIEGVQNAYSTAQKSPITAGFPAYPVIQAGLAGAFSALQIKKIMSTDPSGKSAPSAVGGGGGGGGSAPAPQFNLVGSTGVNQIASQIGQDQQPQRAYVVSSDVTTQQALDRNTVQNATLG